MDPWPPQARSRVYEICSKRTLLLSLTSWGFFAKLHASPADSGDSRRLRIRVCGGAHLPHQSSQHIKTVADSQQLMHCFREECPFPLRDKPCDHRLWTCKAARIQDGAPATKEAMGHQVPNKASSKNSSEVRSCACTPDPNAMPHLLIQATHMMFLSLLLSLDPIRGARTRDKTAVVGWIAVQNWNVEPQRVHKNLGAPSATVSQSGLRVH